MFTAPLLSGLCVELIICVGRRGCSRICIRIYSSLCLHRQEPTSKLLYHAQAVAIEDMDLQIVEACQNATSWIASAVHERSQYGRNVVCVFNEDESEHRAHYRLYKCSLHC